jgi:hypothetical protein
VAPLSLGPWASFDYGRRQPPTERERPVDRHEVAEADPVPDDLRDALNAHYQAGRSH